MNDGIFRLADEPKKKKNPKATKIKQLSQEKKANEKDGECFDWKQS
jgi:hypothetical protein